MRSEIRGGKKGWARGSESTRDEGIIKPLQAGGNGIMPEEWEKVQIELPILRGTLERAGLEEER